MILFLLVGVILILLVLIQKGRGGGLAGAFGGPGGHSAFGTKTADIFIKATAVLAAIFGFLAIATAWVMRPEEGSASVEPPAAPAPETPGAPATGGTAAPEPPAPAEPAAPDTGAPQAPDGETSGGAGS